MSALDGQCANKRYNDPETTILVLTDGSTQAERVAEWELVFADIASATVHRIDVIECFDSGVIIYRDEGRMQNECGELGRRPTAAATDKPNRKDEPAIDVLHGVPHEALLDYVAANAIDRIIISVCNRDIFTHSFIGNAFITVSQTATVPVMTIGVTEDLVEMRYSMTERRDNCVDRS